MTTRLRRGRDPEAGGERERERRMGGRRANGRMGGLEGRKGGLVGGGEG